MNNVKAQTLVVSVRFKPSTLATLAKFLALNGIEPTSVSQVARTGLEHLELMVLEQFPETDFENENEAVNYLDGLRLVSQSKQNAKRVFGILSNESLTQTLNENSSRPKPGKINVTQAEVEKALAEYSKKQPKEVCPMSIPLDEFRKQMLGGKNDDNKS